VSPMLEASKICKRSVGAHVRVCQLATWNRDNGLSFVSTAKLWSPLVAN
jgi:hypothetical protein